MDNRTRLLSSVKRFLRPLIWSQICSFSSPGEAWIRFRPGNVCASQIKNLRRFASLWLAIVASISVRLGEHRRRTPSTYQPFPLLTRCKHRRVALMTLLDFCQARFVQRGSNCGEALEADRLQSAIRIFSNRESRVGEGVMLSPLFAGECCISSVVGCPRW